MGVNFCFTKLDKKGGSYVLETQNLPNLFFEYFPNCHHHHCHHHCHHRYHNFPNLISFKTLFPVTLSSTPPASLKQSYLFGNLSFTSMTLLVFLWLTLDLEIITYSYEGLRSLDESGNLTFFSVPGGEILSFTFREAII